MIKNYTIGLSGDIKKVIKYANISNSLYSHVILIQILSSIFSTISIFLNILFVGKLINSLVSGTNINILIRTTFIFLVIILLANILGGYFQTISESSSSIILKNANRKMSKKMMEVEYSTFINPNFRKLYSSIKMGFMYNGGFMIFVTNCINGITSFVTTLIISMGSLIFMVLEKGNESSRFTDFTNSSIFIFILIILVIVPLISSIFISREEGKVMNNFFTFNMQFNRVIDYYSDILFKNPIFGKTLRMYDQNNETVSKVKNDMYNQIKKDSDYQIKATKISSINLVISYTIIGILYLLISMKSISGAISIGSVVIYVGYLQQLMGGLSSLFMAWGNRQSSFETMNEYMDFMNFESIKDDNDYLKLKDFKEFEIKFNDVSFTYPGSKINSIKNLNLTIKSNETIALVGPNGSGKSTLIKLLIRFLIPTKGTITINGIDINKIDKDQYLSLFSVVFQDFSLTSFSVKENILSNSLVDDNDKLEKTLKNSGIFDKIEKLPEKENTFIGTKIDSKGIQFSGGELQKIAISRAWYKDSPIIILDEPTSALDPISEQEIYDRFNELIKDKTGIYISHRMSSTKNAKKIIVLKDGSIYESGTHAELINSKGLYYKLYSEQSKYYN